jgi:hypothetical protein
MSITESSLFTALEAALKAASEPLDCQSLYDLPPVKKHAASANRVSDYLGNMWRKGQVVRTPAPKTANNRSRWLYAWKGQKGPALYGTEYTPKILADRPSMLISEEGRDVIIELENLVITVRQKPGK